jgi:hypothetical protein
MDTPSSSSLQNMDFALAELQQVARMPSFRAVFIRSSSAQSGS